MKTLAILFIVIGGIMTLFTGFNINKTEKAPVYWSPVTGSILLVSGIVLLATNKPRTV